MQIDHVAKIVMVEIVTVTLKGWSGQHGGVEIDAHYMKDRIRPITLPRMVTFLRRIGSMVEFSGCSRM